MSDANPTHFTCEGCGKRYTWKPDLAGRKVKCKCGTVMRVPGAKVAAATKTPAAKSAPAPAPARLSRGPQLDLDAEPAAGANCPACKKDLVPGAVLCVHCGYNLKTKKRLGQHVDIEDDDGPAYIPPSAYAGAGGAPVIAAPAPAVPSPFGIAPPRVRVEPESERNWMAILIPVGALVVVALLVGGIMLLRATRPQRTYLGDDEEVIRDIKTENGTELRKWLQDKRHMVMGKSPSQADGLADKFYDMGAKQVIAFGAGISSTLALELPDNPTLRAQLFAWENNYAKQIGDKPTKDVGQQYLLIRMTM